MRYRHLITAVVLAACLGWSAFGQASSASAVSTQAILAYADDFTLVTITDPNGAAIVAVEGAQIPTGGTIRTGATSVELSLRPNGTLMRLAPGSAFTIERLERGEERLNAFALIAGKLRTVAANVRGTAYRIRVQQTVFGVRGTDFILQTGAPDSPDALVVLEGFVEAFDVDGYRRSLIEAGNLLTFATPEWNPAPIPNELLSSIIQNEAFRKLDPSTVPRIPGYRNDFPYDKDMRPESSASPQTTDASDKRETDRTASPAKPAVEPAPGPRQAAPIERQNRTVVDTPPEAKKGGGFLLTVDGSYGRFLSADTRELGTSGFGGALGFALRHEGQLSFATGFTAGAFLLDDGGAGIDRIITVPITGFVATDVPLSDAFFFGVRLDGGAQFAMIAYASDTDFPDESGFVPYIAARASFGVGLGPARTETFVSIGVVTGDLVMPLAQAGVSLTIGF